jgi:rare lipoprotein A
MKHLVGKALLVLALVAGAALPAAAETWDKRHWFEGGLRPYLSGEAAAPAQVSRPQAARRQRAHTANRAHRASKHAARSGKSTRGFRAANRRGKGNDAVAQGVRQTAKPAAVAAAKPESQPAQSKVEAAKSQKKAAPPEKKADASQAAPKAVAPKQQAARPSSGGQHGIASFYWQPQRVAAGGWFNPNAMTAAHKTLPFGTRVRVTHQGNGRSVEVVINDRGPYIAGRIIDLSKAAAAVIGMTGQGIARVSVEVIGR